MRESMAYFDGASVSSRSKATRRGEASGTVLLSNGGTKTSMSAADGPAGHLESAGGGRGPPSMVSEPRFTLRHPGW